MKKNAPLLYCLLGILVLLSACKRDLPENPKPSEFTKVQREQLGYLLKEAILERPQQFQLVSNKTPQDSTIYYLVQTLYDQATLRYRLDRNAPTSDRWHRDRPWQVFFLKDDKEIMFVLEGGDLFISTGVLKNLKSEAELYFMMTFEATLMQERKVLNRMIEEYGILSLLRVLESPSTFASKSSIRVFIDDIRSLQYDNITTQAVDKLSCMEVCSSSIYDPRAAGMLINRFSLHEPWLMTRPSYSGRSKALLNFDNPSGACGTLVTNGVYKNNVLDLLP